ncbi:hypothetical protein KQI84_12415 [bacterium]|nr:hypothetical protein [bacterium]
MDSKPIRLQPSLSARDFEEFKQLATAYGWGNIRSDSEMVRLALFEWIQIRKECRLPIPDLIEKLGADAQTPPPVVTSIRLQVSLAPEEHGSFREAAERMGWARVPEALMTRLALMEWCDIRRVTMGRPGEVIQNLDGNGSV